jgi:hypothetical protein
VSPRAIEHCWGLTTRWSNTPCGFESRPRQLAQDEGDGSPRQPRVVAAILPLAMSRYVFVRILLKTVENQCVAACGQKPRHSCLHLQQACTCDALQRRNVLGSNTSMEAWRRQVAEHRKRRLQTAPARRPGAPPSPRGALAGQPRGRVVPASKAWTCAATLSDSTLGPPTFVRRTRLLREDGRRSWSLSVYQS